MELFGIKTIDFGDDDECSVFKTIGLEDVNDKRIEYKDEEASRISDVEAAVLDSDAKMKPDDFNEKCIELDDFVAMEMFGIERIDFDNDDELPVFEKIGLEDINDKRIENEDEKAYDIKEVEVALLDAVGEIEPDDFNDKCIELNEFAAMEMFDTETTDLGDDDKFPVFETIELEDVNNKRVENEEEGA